MPRCLLAVYAGLLLLLAAASAVGGLLLFRDLSSGDPIDAVANRHAYDVMGWELRHFPQKWLYKLATIFDGGRSGAEGGALLRRYFALADEIGQLERRGDGADRLAEARRERDGIENDVEETLESRISDFLRDQDLAMNPPLFSDIDLLFPPVDFELDRPPKLLAVPRASVSRWTAPTSSRRAWGRTPSPPSRARRRRRASPRSSLTPAASPPTPASSRSWRPSAKRWRPSSMSGSTSTWPSTPSDAATSAAKRRARSTRRWPTWRGGSWASCLLGATASPSRRSRRDRAGSAARFVRLVRGLSSEADLDRLLEGP